MTLKGTVQKAPAGLKGFDADTVITEETAAKFVADGYTFCARYLSLGEESHSDLTPEEATTILNAGLALIPVQHVRMPGWKPDAQLGITTGVAAATNAHAVGFPKGVNVWLDLEGVAAGTAADDVIGYCNAWYNEVANAGYVPGIYVGADSVLTSGQLYADLKFAHYWKSESRVPDVERRGYQLVQHFEPNLVNGIGIDIDNTQNDNLGGQVLWLKQ